MSTLTEVLSTWRTTNQGHQGLLSKLVVDGALYDIKDPALEALATEIETRLSAQETKTIRDEALAKPNDAGKFATAVTQGVNGQIAVTYSNFTGLTDTAVDGQFVTKVDQGTDGEITVTRAGVDDSQVTLSAGTLTALGLTGTQSVSSALSTLKDANDDLLGTNADGANANTIYGAKAYADQAVAALAGQDWEQNAKKVQEIIAELEDSENGNAWLTAIDKLAGMSVVGKTATAQDAAAYNERLDGAIKAGKQLTAAEATAVNAVNGISKTYSEGDVITTADSITYNGTLQGAIVTGQTYTDNNPTVKEYVAAEIAKVNAANQKGISDLDAVVYSGSNGSSDATATAATSYTNDTTSKVAVKLTEVDGVITNLDVKVNDVASASDLQTLDGAVVKTINSISPTNNAVTLTGADINVSSTDSTKIDSAISSLDSNKANKNAIGNSTVNNWSASYVSETLTWTNTSTAVFVPNNNTL